MRRTLPEDVPGGTVSSTVPAGKTVTVGFRVMQAGQFTFEWRPVRGGAHRAVEGQVHAVTQAEWNEMFK